ncbi:MAG: recombinase RecA [Bdellovibrionaceae bacterium]|nr:recombinase RecA [Bdellovibrionales bacterium]MCB9253794.1 recombinase RecA [Pseudobdellovibrionaceae bacterium]
MDNLDTQNRQKAVEMALLNIEKQFGKGSIMKMGDRGLSNLGLGVVPTGCLSLDVAMGVGGLPRGRITEIYGPEASGKTTIALMTAANAQRNGGVAAFIDAEHALDTTYAAKLGVNTNDLLISQPDSGEQALEIAEILVRSGGIDVIVVDSVAALVPRAELEGDMGDSHMGLQARLMSQALRKLTGCVSKSKTAMIFINQLRMKIGVMFGNPETTTGGNALKFYASMRLDIRRISALKKGEEVIGSRTRVKVVKNKMAPPFRQTEFDMIYGEGISREGDLLDLATRYDIIEKSGSWFSYEGERLGQGRDNTRLFLKDNPKYVDKIKKKIEEKLAADGQYVPAAEPKKVAEAKTDGAPKETSSAESRASRNTSGPVRPNPKKSN